MNRTLSILLITAFSITLFSCASSSRMTASWVDPAATTESKSNKTVFIAAMSRNMEARTRLEDALAKEAADHGVKAIKSTDFFTPEFYNTTPAKEQMIGRIRESGADAILTVSVIDQKNETRWVPGTPYAPYSRFGWYGGFYNYYSYRYPYMYDPGHYEQDKTYFLETNLYDVETEKLIWSGQSETVNPSGISKFVKDYPKVLVKRMQADGLLQ